MSNGNKDKALIILIICFTASGIIIGFFHPGGLVASLIALIMLCYRLIAANKVHVLTLIMVVLLVVCLSFIGYGFGYTQASSEIGEMISQSFK
jgi:hypothetical protein